MSKRHQYKKPERRSKEWKKDFLDDRKVKLSIGLLLIVTSLVLGVSFLSYCWTGKADQSTVESLWSVNLQDSGREVQNFMGIIGAVLSYLFVYRWFGLGSFILLPLLFHIGYRWTTFRVIFSEKRYAQGMIFWLFWLSTFLGYIALFFDSRSTISFLCGGIGLEMASLISGLFGWATILILLLFMAIYTIFYMDINTIDQWKDRINASMDTANAVKGSVKQTFKRQPDVPYDDSENFMYQKDKTQKQPPFVKKDKPNDTTTPPPITKKETEAKNNEYEFNLESPVKPTVPTKTTDSKLTKKDNQPSFSVEDTTEFQEKTVVNPVFIAEDDVLEPESEADKVPAYIKYGLYDPKLDLRNYTFPTLELLHPPAINKLKVTREELESNKEKIVETLSHFNISIDTIKATVGPTVTLYEIVPQAGIKISKIKNLEDDIALSLSALGIRIIAPIPGRGTIGIEVPNKNREVVPISSLLATEKFQKTDAELPIVLGKTISNEVFMADLSKMPHLLMAGATGQGKSVGLNIILTSLLYKKHPAELKLVLVDPKKVELTLFNRIERHYLAMLPGSEEAIITDTKKVVHTLNSLCIEMDIRYGLLKDAACRNIKEYNEKFTKRMLNPDEGHRFLPYIVLVIDELADLMMTAGKEVETPIARLAQLARAIGIHLIVATQRPSVNVITGIIKANFPARLSFKVASKVDSRTILDTGGADQLVGQGDMLLSNGSDIIRLQCAFVATDEVEKICNHIGKEQGYSMPYQLPEFEDENAEPESKVVDLTNRDSMFEEAARLVVAHQQGSTSLIQRKLSLGYNRAGRIMDQLEAAGIVGAFEGSKARKVLVPDEVMLSEILRSLA